MTTFSRWSDLWYRLGAQSSPVPIFEELAQAYHQPHRAYHTLDHIHNCLTQFDLVRHLAQFPDEVEFALWCHDVIYDPHATDNEAQSAAWTARILRQAAVVDEVIARVTGLILATQHHAPFDDPDAVLIVDIDLSILGRPAAEFDRNEAAIRQEYHWVPETAYREARLRVLEAFLMRPSLYQTASFRERHEAQAQANLARSIRHLRKI
ncbi:MAG: N-methyl-D-aspartate receptor NMDAR2C subunit [Chloroflexi bacterium]|nr:N-methyl-D-aspartate receptor NMDAR2C subunit [Chloroflexota bacterium]